MTTHEIDLPYNDNLGAIAKTTPSSHTNTNNNSKTDLSSFANTSTSTIPDLNTPIQHHYLTFETTLPHPTTGISSTPNGPTPAPPNLKKYTSPFEWPERKKNGILWLSCIATLITAATAGSYSPAVAQMSAEWGISDVATVVGITTFCCGFAIAPMVLAPFSEINGRYPVFVAAGILYFVCQLCCAVTHSYPGMLVARFFVGCGSSVFSTMVGGVVSDLYHAQDRNTPMALFSGAALFGTGVGPLVAGFLAENLNWRWVFWVQTIFVGVLVACITLFLSETRGSILLSRKAAVLNKWYEEREAAGYVGFDMIGEDGEKMWVAFSWAVLYLTFAAIPLIFETSHNFSLQQANSVFAAMMVGATLATVLSIYQDRLLARYLLHSSKNQTSTSKFRNAIDLSSPEARLYFACIESALLPIGLFWFGWTSFPSVPWIVPALSVACSTMGIYSIYLATFNYLADTYHRYASSALAAQSFCRNMLGGVFPLVTVAMFRNLTFQGAASLLGGVGTLLTAVPWVLVFFGPRIRGRSRFALGQAV
ncbi:MFS general substrate transporter [Glarea lozoyensis ATCC 20868]|uniref:MFS general substrate transporter n=1 Tax=Glarea lozoyensis (strain ATCC 20868 / MF5171) TaxID=1116229 RepID=S3DE60_GLAL2|nr:MFS general substrate transporter [Glarea lozoyensis ATCC 20868]EPE30256.1 MFS general substrate transporter [Glarea lozoyensis ATCC 20868]